MPVIPLLYPPYFKLQVRWLSSLTPVTYLSKLQGILCVAAFLQLELFRVYRRWLCRGCRRGWGVLTAPQRMALLLQVTQWQIQDMDEEDYRRWL